MNNVIVNWGLISASLLMSITALGAGIGVNIVGQAAIGAWKKCFQNNKAAPMVMLAFVGNLLSQVLYAYILMGRLMTAAEENPERAFVYVGFALAAGASLFASEIVQGKLGACAVVAIADARKGFAQYIAVIGVAETVALFTMVFTVASL